MSLARPARPCPECGCPSRWIDGADRRHCDQCDPPPSLALVKSREILAAGKWDAWPEFDVVRIERDDPLVPGPEWISFDSGADAPPGWRWSPEDPQINPAWWRSQVELGRKNLNEKGPGFDRDALKLKTALVTLTNKKARQKAAQKLSSVKKKAKEKNPGLFDRVPIRGKRF